MLCNILKVHFYRHPSLKACLEIQQRIFHRHKEVIRSMDNKRRRGVLVSHASMVIRVRISPGYPA